MTGEKVIALAREVGLTFELPPTKLLQFAALLAQYEREECARLVENYNGAWDDEGQALAADIRNSIE